MIKLLILIVTFASFNSIFASQKSECKKWCDNHKYCQKCSTLRYCGPFSTPLKHFTGAGRNYHACKKQGTITHTLPRHPNISINTETIVITAGGASGIMAHDGFEWFCEDYLAGAKEKDKIFCSSNFGFMTDNSNIVARKIRNIYNQTIKKTGKTPKLILVGKSMGACKLHHATDNLDRYGIDVDLFIGNEMSCGIDQHWQNGISDSLEFPQNVKDFLVFYQTKKGEIQNSHAAIYEEEKQIDYTRHINVNLQNYIVEEKRKTQESTLCNNVGHMDFDNCKPLLQKTKEIILQEAGLI